MGVLSEPHDLAEGSPSQFCLTVLYAVGDQVYLAIKSH